MDVQLATRNVLLSGLLALVLLASAFLALAPKAFAETSDCPAGDICLWEGETFGGNRAFFSGSETGCHSLANIDPLSMRNHTGNHTATFGSAAIGPSGEFNFFTPGYTGNLCID